MTADQRDELVAAACQARQNAYAKYSNYQVGAAVRTRSGAIFQGCNVENGSYGLTVCAERVALWSAVAAGQQQIVSLAVATADGVTPCGACRQVLAEFATDIPIFVVTVLADGTTGVRDIGLQELLPERFVAKHVE